MKKVVLFDRSWYYIYIQCPYCAYCGMIVYMYCTVSYSISWLSVSRIVLQLRDITSCVHVSSLVVGSTSKSCIAVALNKTGPLRDSNSGPLLPESSIIPLDQADEYIYKFVLECFFTSLSIVFSRSNIKHTYHIPHTITQIHHITSLQNHINIF